MKKTIKKTSIILVFALLYFLGAGEVIFYPNITPRFITNILVSIGIAWLLFEKEIELMIYSIGTWIYKTDNNQKISDTIEIVKIFGKLLSIFLLFIVFKGIFLITTFVSMFKKSGILETLKLFFLLLGLSVLIPIVYYIEYQYKRQKTNKVIGFGGLFSFLIK